MHGYGNALAFQVWEFPMTAHFTARFSQLSRSNRLLYLRGQLNIIELHMFFKCLSRA